MKHPIVVNGLPEDWQVMVVQQLAEPKNKALRLIAGPVNPDYTPDNGKRPLIQKFTKTFHKRRPALRFMIRLLVKSGHQDIPEQPGEYKLFALYPAQFVLDELRSEPDDSPF